MNSSVSGPMTLRAWAMRSRSRPAAVLQGPPGQLVVQLAVAVGGEPAAAVHRDLGPHRAKQPGQGDAEQPGLQVPQGDVYRGDGVADGARAAVVAHRPDHRLERAADIQ